MSLMWGGMGGSKEGIMTESLEILVHTLRILDTQLNEFADVRICKIPSGSPFVPLACTTTPLILFQSSHNQWISRWKEDNREVWVQTIPVFL